MKTAENILSQYEDSNEMHFHEVDRKWIIEAMHEFASQSRWIDVKERLPELGKEVLWIDREGNQFVDRICDHPSTFLTEEWVILSCSHWQPLPTPPQP